MQKLTRSLFAVGAVLGLAACGDDVSVTPPQEPLPAGIASVTVVPSAVTITIGEKVILQASVATTQGTGTPATTVTWSSANAAIASVAASGEVTGVAAGTTTIVATSTADASKKGAAAVTVRAPQIQSVSVSPQSLSLQVGQTATAVASVNRDPGASGAVTWASTNAAVATVSATGQIAAVAVGNAVITATSTADNTKSAALAVTVVAVPNNLSALSVAPTSANLGIGGSVQLVPSATTVGTPTVTYTYQSSNTAVATVSATGLVSAVGNGTAVVTTTATTNTNSLSVSTTINVASASVSISSITAGGLGTPVNIANVAGQIEVTMNISAGNQTLDSVRVKLGSKSAATQGFTVNGAPNAPVSLSINTADYTVNADSTATVSFANGSTVVQAELFVTGASGPTASNTITINLNNADTFHARWNLPSQTSAVSSAGFLWYGGPTFNTTINVIPVMYSGNTITSATIHMDDASVFGNASLCGAAVVDATAPFTGSFTCTGVTNTTVQPGVAASLRGDGNAGPAGVDAVNNSSIRFANGAALVQSSAVPVRVDVAGPGAATYAFVAPTTNDYWANASFRHDTSAANLFSRARGVDGGVGTAAASTDVYEYEDRAVGGSTLAWVTHTANTTNIPENPVDFTVNAYNGRVTEKDLLGNATITYLGGGASPGAQNFGVDVSAPTLDYLTATQNALVVLPATDTLGNTKILNDLVNVTGGINSTNGLFGVRMRDTRSGFNVTTTGNSGLFKQIARLGVTGSTCALGGTSCAYVRDTAIVDITDPTYRRDSVNVYGTLTATTPGYYTYSAYAVDRAGNVSPTITKQIAIDITAPVITGLPVPAALNGAQPLAIIPTGLDDLEIWKAAGYLTYPNLTNPLHFPISVFPAYGTPFDNVLATPVGFSGAIGAAGITLPINFLRGIDVVQADSTPPAAVSGTYNPTFLGAQFYDIKRSSTAFAAATPDSSGVINSAIPAGLVSGTPVPFSAVGVGQWFIFGAGTTGSQIEARALTSTVITNPPFPQVAFFRLSGGTWTYLGHVNANAPTNPTLFDSGTNRFWTYRLSGVSPALATGNQLIAVGMSAAGDGLATLTLTQP